MQWKKQEERAGNKRAKPTRRAKRSGLFVDDGKRKGAEGEEKKKDQPLHHGARARECSKH